MKRILIIPKIKIHNANALSSPFTIGFPAMTAWLGAVHALQRKVNTSGFEEVKFIQTGIVCHEIDMQTYKGRGDFVHSIIGTGNPLEKTGKRPSFIEEARCHLTVSLVIEFKDLDIDDYQEFIELLINLIQTMKFASGDMLSCETPVIEKIVKDEDIKIIMKYLMPGHCLIERKKLMQETMEQGQDAIDALLDYIKITTKCERDEKDKVTWKTTRKAKGWLVPIAVGFHGISELNQVLNQRDGKTPHRFAESVVTLGEFIMPYRLDNIGEMLWHYDYDKEAQLYLCKQTKI